MNFTPNHVRSQFTALSQQVNDQSVVFLDGPGGSQVPSSVLSAMTGYLGYANSNLGGHFFQAMSQMPCLNRLVNRVLYF